MGILDDLKHKAEELGDKARGGIDAARDKAGDLIDDARDKAGDLIDDAKQRIGHDDAPLTESGDIGPDSASTDAEQPGYVTGEDAVDDESDEAALDGLDGLDGSDEDGDDDTVATPASAAPEALVETDVDPYDAPLTESIGDEIASSQVDSDAVAEAVGTPSTEQDA